MLRYFKISKSSLGVKHLTAAFFRKDGRPMLVHLLRQLYLIGGRPNRNWAQILKIYLRFINRLYKHQGYPGVVKYLKVSGVYIQQVIAGQRLSDATALGPKVRRCKSGLPSFIPIPHRINIRSGDPVVIRFWSTLCSIYRDLKFEGVVKLSSIIKPSDKREPDVSQYASRFMKLFINPSSLPLQESKPFPILTSAPSVRGEEDFSTSFSSLKRSVLGFTHPNSEQLLASLWYILTFTSSNSVLDLFQRVVHYVSLYNEKSKGIRRSFLGKLAIKEEAAGKMRVFAMVDPWTQWALRPLHRWLFSNLRRWPMDGTFDQLKPLSRVPFGKAPIYSYDLTAATDRLPITIQKELLTVVFGSKFSDAWAYLLVNRDYQISHLQFPYPYLAKVMKGETSVRYAVGQPMGAYSSWAMLALTHHFIVQMAAWTANVVPRDQLFKSYAVLGDDIVIWDRLVAEAYYKLMTSYGVEIGIAKSVVSPEGLGLEFAKKTLFKGMDVSPAPLKEAKASHSSTSAALELRRKYNLSNNQWLRFLGYGYQVSLDKNTQSMKVIRTVMSIPKTYSGLRELFAFAYSFLNPRAQLRVKLHKVVIQLLVKELSALELLIKKEYYSLLQWDTARYMHTYKVFHGEQVAKMTQILVDADGSRTTDYLTEMWSLINLLRRALSALRPHQEVVNHPFFGEIAPYEDPMTFSDTTLIDCIQILFRVQSQWSRINLQTYMNPVRRSPPWSEIDTRESPVVIHRWNRWLKVLTSKEFLERGDPNFKF